jgi:hypothetical protein
MASNKFEGGGKIYQIGRAWPLDIAQYFEWRATGRERFESITMFWPVPRFTFSHRLDRIEAQYRRIATRPRGIGGTVAL